VGVIESILLFENQNLFEGGNGKRKEGPMGGPWNTEKGIRIEEGNRSGSLKR